MARFSVIVDDEIVDAIEEQLDYGDSRSQWVENAARMRLNLETDADDGSEKELEA